MNLAYWLRVTEDGGLDINSAQEFSEEYFAIPNSYRVYLGRFENDKTKPKIIDGQVVAAGKILMNEEEVFAAIITHKFLYSK